MQWRAKYSGLERQAGSLQASCHLTTIDSEVPWIVGLWHWRYRIFNMSLVVRGRCSAVWDASNESVVPHPKKPGAETQDQEMVSLAVVASDDASSPHLLLAGGLCVVWLVCGLSLPLLLLTLLLMWLFLVVYYCITWPWPLHNNYILVHTQTHTHTQPFYGCFSWTTRVSR